MTTSSTLPNSDRPDAYRQRGGPLRILVAATRTARSQPVLSVLVAFIAAATVFVTLITVGRTVGTQRAVLARFDTLEVTVIQVIDDQGDAGLDAADVSRVQALSGVDWAIGVGPIDDVRTAGLRGDPVPSRVVVGTSSLVSIGDRADSAYVGPGSQTALGLTVASGAVDFASGRQVPVVGAFRATGPLSGLETSVLLPERGYTGPVRRIYVHATSPDQVLAVAAAIGHAVGDSDGNRPQVQVADDVAAIRATVRGELGGAGRSLALQTLAGGLVIGAITIFAGVQARRRDFGRRRALGATRSQLIMLVVLQTLLAAAPGATVGAIAGAYTAHRLSDAWPGWSYPTAIGTLTLLALGGAAVVPALLAAYRDPVAALRLP